MTREPIYAALFKLLAVPGLVTVSRKLLHWADVPAVQQPALFMAQGVETAMRTTGLPPKWEFAVKLYLYVNTTGAASPAPLVNVVLDSICAALVPRLAGATQTLGGLVHDARIEGAIETDEGTLGDQAVCIIPIRIITAA